MEKASQYYFWDKVLSFHFWPYFWPSLLLYLKTFLFRTYAPQFIHRNVIFSLFLLILHIYILHIIRLDCNNKLYAHWRDSIKRRRGEKKVAEKFDLPAYCIISETTLGVIQEPLYLSKIWLDQCKFLYNQAQSLCMTHTKFCFVGPFENLVSPLVHFFGVVPYIIHRALKIR